MATIRDELVQMICSESSPIEPRPVELPARLSSRLSVPLPRAPRAVLFDIYGTLFVSASGDVGTAAGRSRAELFFRAIELATGAPPSPGTAELLETAYYSAIARSHETSRAAGSTYPEVDILSIWHGLLASLETDSTSGPMDIERLSLAFELSSNPVWPMPGATELVAKLAEGRVRLGIVSNAQFYTRLLFPALIGESLSDLGFEPALMSFSYEHEIAKPDPALFARPLAALRDAGIDSTEVVYVGNDMLNDVATAARAGCMTVLFAGDERSLRVREGDDRVGEIQPDSVIMLLSDLELLLQEAL